MFYIKKSEMTTKTFRLPSDLMAELECLAQNNDISLNNLVTQCPKYALDNLAVSDSAHAIDSSKEENLAPGNEH